MNFYRLKQHKGNWKESGNQLIFPGFSFAQCALGLIHPHYKKKTNGPGRERSLVFGYLIVLLFNNCICVCEI